MSVGLAAAGFLSVWVPVAFAMAGAFDHPEGQETMADTIGGLSFIAGIVMHVLGMAVVFAAPPGRRKLGFWLNAGLVGFFASVVLVLALRA